MPEAHKQRSHAGMCKRGGTKNGTGYWSTIPWARRSVSPRGCS